MSSPVFTLQAGGDSEAGLRSVTKNADSNHLHGRREDDEEEVAVAGDMVTDDDETEDDETMALTAGSPSLAGATSDDLRDSPSGAGPSPDTGSSAQRRKCTRCPETDPSQFTVVQQGEHRRWLKQCNACRAKARTKRRVRRRGGRGTGMHLAGHAAGTEQPFMGMGVGMGVGMGMGVGVGAAAVRPPPGRSEMLYSQPELAFACVTDTMVEDMADDLTEPGSASASASAHGLREGESEGEGEGEDDDQDVDPAEAALRLALATLARGASANASAGASSWSWHDPLDGGKTGAGDGTASLASMTHAAGSEPAPPACATAEDNGEAAAQTANEGQAETVAEARLEGAQPEEAQAHVAGGEAGEHEGAPPSPDPSRSGPPSGSMMLWLAVRKRLWQRQRTARHMLRGAAMLREYVESRQTEQVELAGAASAKEDKSEANLTRAAEGQHEDKSCGSATESGAESGAGGKNGPGVTAGAAPVTAAKKAGAVDVVKSKPARLNKEQFSALFHGRRQTFNDQRAQRWPWQAVSRRHSSGLALDTMMTTISEAIKAPGSDAESARVRESLVEQQLRVLDGLGIELERLLELFQVVLKRLPARWWFGTTSHSSTVTSVADALRKRCETQLTIAGWMGRPTSKVRRFDADTQTFYFKEYEVLVKALASVLGRSRFRELMRVAAGALAAQQHRELELGWHGKGTTARAERARMAAALRMRRRDLAQQRLAVRRAYAHARQLQRERMQAARVRDGRRRGGQSLQRGRGMTKKEQSAQARISKAQFAKLQLEEGTASALARMRMGEFEVQFDHGLLGLSFIWHPSPSQSTSSDNSKGSEAGGQQLRDGEGADNDGVHRTRESNSRAGERRNAEPLRWGTYLVCGTDPWLQLARSDAIATGLEACGFGDAYCASALSRSLPDQLSSDSRPNRIVVGQRAPCDWARYLAGRPSVDERKDADKSTTDGEDAVPAQPKRSRKITHGSDKVMPTAREHLFGFASVVGVTAGAQGQHSPVLPGDRLVAVNGVPCSTTSFENVVSQIADARAAGQRVRLRFHRMLMPMDSEGNSAGGAVLRREDRKRRSGRRKKPAGFTVDHSKWGLYLTSRSATRAGVRAGAKLVFMPTFDMPQHLSSVTRGWGHYLTGRESQPLEKLSLRKSREMQRRDASIFHGVSMLTASGTGIASLHHYEARAPLPLGLRRDPDIQDPRVNNTLRPKREKANSNRMGPALVTASSGTNFNTVFLGVFHDECNAARAYDRAVHALHGPTPPPDVPTNEALLSEVERIGYLKATTYARKELNAQRRNAKRKRGTSANKRVRATKRDRSASKSGASKSKAQKDGAPGARDSSTGHADKSQATAELTERAEIQVLENARMLAELQKQLLDKQQHVSPGKEANACTGELDRASASADKETVVGETSKKSLKRKPKPKSKPKPKRTRLST